jgi:ferric-dicitrate binding protein FerR (iron transport regulator)
MEKKQLTELFKKYHDGTCTEEEKALLEAWYLQYNEQQDVNLSYRQIKAVKDRIFRELPGNHTSFLKAGTRLMAAAALIGVIITIALYFLTGTPKPARHPLVNDVPPGTNKAILKLAGGRSINLSDAKNGRLTAQNGLQIIKSSAGQVTYRVSGAAATDHSLNTITTPKGGQWKIQLPDGTNVWLNAATSLTFPSSFTQLKNRSVSLDGEAYFEVTKDKAHPFIVQSAGQRVEVLGTHFNINSYQDEPLVRTTLAEGSVKVTNDKGGGAKYLTPGKQAILSGGQLTVGDADLQENLAWVNGQFWFSDESIRSIMRKLARWYDIDVQYEGEPSTDGLNGRISRYKNISQVLRALAATHTIHFKMEGRRVTVMK